MAYGIFDAQGEVINGDVYEAAHQNVHLDGGQHFGIICPNHDEREMSVGCGCHLDGNGELVYGKAKEIIFRDWFEAAGK